MKNNLPRLTIAGMAVTTLLLAAGLRAETPASTANSPTHESLATAAKLLDQALAQLASYDSVNAKIRQQVDIGGHELIGDGVYLQTISGRDVLLRMELKVQVGNQLCSSLQVSDGRDLWLEEQRGEQRTVERVAVREVARVLTRQKPSLVELGGGRVPLGGLPEWLHSLTVNFQFAYAGERELAGIPVLMLVGRWRKDSLLEMLPKQKERIEAGQPPDLSQIPAHAPQEVVLLLGQDDYFPYLIDYRRYEPAVGAAAPKPRSILRAQIYEVRLNGPIDLRQFVYQPGQVDVSDATNDKAKVIGNRGRRQAALRVSN